MSGGGDVVLVHGLFYGRWSTGVLAWRLRRRGWRVHHFACSPVRAGRDTAARALARFVRDRNLALPDFVGHSFGGLVIVRAFELEPGLPSGRSVLLGSPLQGSRAARQLMRWAPGRWLLGAAGRPLMQSLERIPENREVGVIAGTTGIGLGLLTGARLGTSDGTIGVDETDAEGIAARIEQPVSHTGLLLSARIAGLVDQFLREGDFHPGSGARD